MLLVPAGRQPERGTATFGEKRDDLSLLTLAFSMMAALGAAYALARGFLSVLLWLMTAVPAKRPVARPVERGSR
jgi:hypothetical protein